MQAKSIAITGPTSGIGRSSSLALARQGAQLTLFCRDKEKGQALAEEIAGQGGQPAEVIVVNMADLGSVRRAAEQFLASGRTLDVLLNNAGVVNTSRRQSVDGFEETLAVNHLAPFLLTGMLLPALQSASSARIVNVSSNAHAFVRGMGFDDMQAERNFRVFREYGRSKLANILFTRALAARLDDTPVTANCLHPGAVATALGKNNGGLLSSLLPLLLKPFFLSPDQGAETSIYLCLSAEVEGVSGEYFSKCKRAKAKPWAQNDEAAHTLWEYSEKAVGFSYPI